MKGTLQNLNVKLSYPKNTKFDYFMKMERINLDEECKKDLSNMHGFIIKEPPPINKALDDDNSIFSSKFGKSLRDKDPYANRYSCKYGCTQGSFNSVPNNKHWVCPICGTEIKNVGDDFTYFGWIETKEPYKFIHPNMYDVLSVFLGPDNLESIIEPEVELDADGKPMSGYDKRLFKKKASRRFKKKTSIDNKYAGIGLLGFREHFDEIMKYFYSKKATTPLKKAYYADIMANRNIIFCNHLPVYTTQLRIAKVEHGQLAFENTNADFNILATLAAKINKDYLSVYRNTKYQNQLLWDMQMHIKSISTEIISILTGKKGAIRSIITGRTAMSERSVITPLPSLRMDEVTLPYHGLVLLMEQILINIIKKSYNITYSNAYKIWYYASLKVDQRVLDIINNMIKTGSIKVLINRNPTISYQSIIFKRVVGCTLDFTMGMDEYTLKGLGADFDGDTLNIELLLNKEFSDACEEIFSPVNAFCISRNDGRFNPSVNIFKDTLINLNGLINLSKYNYTNNDKIKLNSLKEKYKGRVL